MANKVKTGLDYFPFEINFFKDIKVRKLIKYQGCKSTSVYTLLLCNIYENGYYLRWDNELPFMISEVTGYEEGYVSEVIRCCFQVDLFSREMFDSNKVITSKGIQDRYREICKQLKRRVIVSEYLIIDSETMPNNSEGMPNNSESIPQRKGKEKKVNEKKVNEKKDIAPTSAVTFEAVKLEITGSDQWIERTAMTKRLTIPALMEHLDIFLTDLHLKEDYFKGVKDIKEHFINWLNLRLQKEKPKAAPVYVKPKAIIDK